MSGFKTIENFRLVDGEKLDQLPSVNLTGEAGKILSVNTSENGYELINNTSSSPALNDLTDVEINSPINGQVITYNTSTGDWENKTLPGGGDMLSSIYDPQNIADNAFARANHTGTQTADTLTDGTINKVYTTTEKNKLAGIESDAEVNITENVNAGTNITIDRTGKDITINSTGGGGGDMLKSTYDTNNNGIVDNSEALNGENGFFYLDTDNHLSGVNNKVYTTTEKNKLAGIEAGATADQTATEIKTAYESNTNTNAYTDTEKTKLADIEDGAEVNTVDSVNGRTGAISGLAEDNEVVKLAGHQTIAGDLTLSGILKRTEAKYSITATSGTIDLNYNNGNFQDVSLTGTTTFTISNENIGILILEINDGDAYSITWDSSITWANGEAAPTLTSRSIVSLWRSSAGDLLGDWQNFTA